MKGCRKALRTTLRLLAVCIGIALAGSVNVPGVRAATALPLAKLSLAQRLSTLPDSTAIQLGTRMTTLGALRAAHQARETALARASSMGSLLHGKPIPLQVTGLHSLGSADTNAVTSGKLQVSPQPVVEPPSQYASSPADMKAFCSAAAASACLFLPPNQQVTTGASGVADWDSLITQTQCNGEGGTWGAIWNGSFCAFNYPASVTVHFTPAANFKLTQSANCDKSTFTYDVDTHGAITISLKNAAPAIVTTDNNPTCVVSVVPGA